MSENLTKDLPPEGVELILASLSSINTGLSTLEAGVRSIDTRLTTLEAGVRSIDTRLTTLEERVDRRLSETRPIWEQVLSRLVTIDGRLGGIDERQNGFDKQLSSLDAKIENLGLDMRAGFKRLERQMAQLASDVVAVRTDQVDLERRMDRLEDKLEVKPAP